MPGPGGVPGGDPPDGYCYGRYASYWNAFLYAEVFTLQLELYLYLCPYFGTTLVPLPVQLKLCVMKPLMWGENNKKIVSVVPLTTDVHSNEMKPHF